MKEKINTDNGVMYIICYRCGDAVTGQNGANLRMKFKNHKRLTCKYKKV